MTIILFKIQLNNIFILHMFFSTILLYSLAKSNAASLSSFYCLTLKDFLKLHITIIL